MLTPLFVVDSVLVGRWRIGPSAGARAFVQAPQGRRHVEVANLGGELNGIEAGARATPVGRGCCRHRLVRCTIAASQVPPIPASLGTPGRR